ncbi:hypothetical protein, conserved [Plasmodium ovale curtisi]|uniref:Uncharacterized protein n=1 Tax=Plasmodium ovale curtisi TaxID=864141 RepID=A0A1A8VTU4_PLAOA|nr:hypothetical protein, conserved [Plasmodium ovale curtisi]
MELYEKDELNEARPLSFSGDNKESVSIDKIVLNKEEVNVYEMEEEDKIEKKRKRDEEEERKQKERKRRKGEEKKRRKEDEEKNVVKEKEEKRKKKEEKRKKKEEKRKKKEEKRRVAKEEKRRVAKEEEEKRVAKEEEEKRVAKEEEEKRVAKEEEEKRKKKEEKKKKEEETIIDENEKKRKKKEEKKRKKDTGKETEKRVEKKAKIKDTTSSDRKELNGNFNKEDAQYNHGVDGKKQSKEINPGYNIMSISSVIKVNISLRRFNAITPFLNEKDEKLIREIVISLGKKYSMKLLDLISKRISENRLIAGICIKWIKSIYDVYKFALKDKKYRKLHTRLCDIVEVTLKYENILTHVINKINYTIDHIMSNNGLKNTAILNYVDGTIMK